MKQIRKRARLDRLQTEIRARKHSFSKWIYITAVLILLFWFLDIFFGEYVYFKAEGLVSQKQHTVATHYTTSIEELYVEVGGRVEEGQIISRGVSMEILNDLALLKTRLSEIYVRKSEISSRLKSLKFTLPIARKRSQEMKKLSALNKAALADGLTTTQRYTQILEDEYNSVREYEKTKAELAGGDAELEVLDITIRQANSTLDQLTSGYNDGKIVSRTTGIISKINVSPGSVVKAGEPVVEILTGVHYVLAYASPGAFYDPIVGGKVTISYGVNEVAGKIEEIFPISYKLPEEIQKAFRPKDRSQVLRISFRPKKGEKIPPTFTKVRVKAPGYFLKNILDRFK